MGKSTLVRRVVENLTQFGISTIGGFYTLEMRSGTARTGFTIHTIDGRTGRLAEVGLPSRHRLGRYGIDLAQFETVALTALEQAIAQQHLVVIDEIGFMELKSRGFQQLVRRALDGPSPVLATIMGKPFYFADEIKQRDDVELITVRADNRDALVLQISDELKRPLLDHYFEGI